MGIRSVLIFIGILITLLLTMASLYFFGGDEPADPNFTSLPSGQGNQQQPAPTPGGGGRSASVSTVPGSPVPARPLLGHSDTTEVTNDGLYKNTSSDDSYAIFYYEPNATVTILLYQEPLQFYRLLAEEQLRDIFPNEDGLCDMRIQIHTNEHVNPVYSKGDLGLSFCPGSVEFEQ